MTEDWPQIKARLELSLVGPPHVNLDCKPAEPDLRIVLAADIRAALQRDTEWALKYDELHDQRCEEARKADSLRQRVVNAEAQALADRAFQNENARLRQRVERLERHDGQCQGSGCPGHPQCSCRCHAVQRAEAAEAKLARVVETLWDALSVVDARPSL